MKQKQQKVLTVLIYQNIQARISSALLDSFSPQDDNQYTFTWMEYSFPKILKTILYRKLGVMFDQKWQKSCSYWVISRFQLVSRKLQIWTFLSKFELTVILFSLKGVSQRKILWLCLFDWDLDGSKTQDTSCFPWTMLIIPQPTKVRTTKCGFDWKAISFVPELESWWPKSANGF